MTNSTMSKEDLQDLGKAHEPILRMAVSSDSGFRYQMPEGGQEAIDAALVVQRDPTWMMSDDYRACNGFTLTPLGESVARAMGWACQCAGCETFRRARGWQPMVSNSNYCNGCQGSMDQYGAQEHHGQVSCGWHAKLLVTADDQLNEHCLTATRIGMARPPGQLSAETTRRLLESIHGLQIYTAVNQLHSANAALARLEADLRAERQNGEGSLDDAERYDLWKEAGASIAGAAGPGLEEALTAAGSSPDLRRAVDFLTGSSYGTPLNQSRP